MVTMRVLNVINFAETEAENSIVTIAPMHVTFLIAYNGERQGRPVKRVIILADDGASLEVFISEYDLTVLQAAVGSYSLDF